MHLEVYSIEVQRESAEPTLDVVLQRQMHNNREKTVQSISTNVDWQKLTVLATCE